MARKPRIEFEKAFYDVITSMENERTLVLKQLVRIGHFTIGMVEVYKPLDILWLNRMINHRVFEWYKE